MLLQIINDKVEYLPDHVRTPQSQSVVDRIGLDTDVNDQDFQPHISYNEDLATLWHVALSDPSVGFHETYLSLNTRYGVHFCEDEDRYFCQFSRGDVVLGERGSCVIGPNTFNDAPGESFQEMMQGYGPSNIHFSPRNKWLLNYSGSDVDVLSVLGVNELFCPYGRDFNRVILELWGSGYPRTKFRRQFDLLMGLEQRAWRSAMRQRQFEENEFSRAERDHVRSLIEAGTVKAELPWRPGTSTYQESTAASTSSKRRKSAKKSGSQS